MNNTLVKGLSLLERLAREERAGEIRRRAFPTERRRAVDPARTAF